MGIENVGSV